MGKEIRRATAGHGRAAHVVFDPGRRERAVPRLPHGVWATVLPDAVPDAHLAGMVPEGVLATLRPGLRRRRAPAKPIIDLDVAIRTKTDLPAAIERLARLCYAHEGDKGIRGRAAFAWPPQTVRHHLYVYALDSAEYRCHLLFRDYLRTHPETMAAYAALKRQLAARYRVRRDAYTEAKGPFVRAAMARAEEWARMTGWAVPGRQA
jgi:GrpB protein